MERSRSAFEETMAEKPKEELRFKAIARNELSAAGGVTEALEAVPGLAGIPLLTDRKERYLHLNNEREILKQFEKPFDIPRPELFLQPTFNGSRDVEETTAIISLNEVNIQYCFEKYARYDPTLTGDVKVQFTIHPDGHVIPASIKIIESTIRDPRILRCIKKNLERWRNFPAVALENGNFTMTRKYVF